jgi:hypothetical protein
MKPSKKATRAKPAKRRRAGKPAGRIFVPPTLVTIPAGEVSSNAIDLTSKNLLALIAPAAWTPAVLSLQMSVDGVTFYHVSHWSTDQVFLIPVVPEFWVPLTGTQMFPNNSCFLKLHSGHPNAPIAQEEERVFQLVTA